MSDEIKKIDEISEKQNAPEIKKEKRQPYEKNTLGAYACAGLSGVCGVRGKEALYKADQKGH